MIKEFELSLFIILCTAPGDKGKTLTSSLTTAPPLLLQEMRISFRPDNIGTICPNVEKVEDATRGELQQVSKNAKIACIPSL